MEKNQSNFIEEDIRPSAIIDGQHNAILIDVGRLLMERENFVQVSCPACGENKPTPVYKKYGLDYVACPNCNTMYINPRPSVEVLEKCYRESNVYAYWDKYVYPASDIARKEKMYRPRVDRLLDFCKKYNVNTESILEVGSAYGTFCEEVAARGIFKRVVGIEPTPDLANTCRSKGIETIELPVEKVSFNENEKFDIVVNFEVIEHLFSPEEFVKKCKTFLKPGGLFVASCPNGKGFDFIVLQEKCQSVDHEHLNYFNPESLNLLLTRCGLEVLETLTPGKLDTQLVRKRILSNEFDVSTNPFLKQLLIDNWEKVGAKFQDFLVENNLSSSLWIIGRNS